VFRKLARELVIFMFICGFIGASWAAIYTVQSKPIPKIADTPTTLDGVPDAHGYTIEPPPFDPSKPYTALRSCPPNTDAWSVYAQISPCQLTPEQQNSIREQNIQIYKDALQSRRVAVALAGLFGFLFGAAVGIVAWILYRGARFAITG